VKSALLSPANGVLWEEPRFGAGQGVSWAPSTGGLVFNEWLAWSSTRPGGRTGRSGEEKRQQ